MSVFLLLNGTSLRRFTWPRDVPLAHEILWMRRDMLSMYFFGDLFVIDMVLQSNKKDSVKRNSTLYKNIFLLLAAELKNNFAGPATWQSELWNSFWCRSRHRWNNKSHWATSGTHSQATGTPHTYLTAATSKKMSIAVNPAVRAYATLHEREGWPHLSLVSGRRGSVKAVTVLVLWVLATHLQGRMHRSRTWTVSKNYTCLALYHVDSCNIKRKP